MLYYIMPYIIRKLPNKDLYKVINRDTKVVHSNGSTYENAIKQVRLLNMIDAGVPLKKDGNGIGNKKLLELFKGTGSVGKQAKKMGFNVISLDLDPIYTPDIETDILNWDYKKWSNENNYIPDMIWSSPPCNTFSPMVYRLKERDTQTAEPKSERAKIGTKVLYKTLEIINYFKSKNPNLLFVIENPRGMMRMDAKMKKFARETTLYCLYGDFKKKPTDFWNNFPDGLNLNQTTKQCPNKTIPVQISPNIKNLNLDQRYSMPSKLIKHFLTEFEKQYSKKGGSIETDKFEADGIVSLPEFNGVKIDLPTYMYKRLPDIKGNPPPYRYRLVIPITKSRNLSSRQAEISVGINQKPVSKPIVNIKENDNPPILEEFSPADRAKIRDYYYNVKANEKKNPDKIDKDDYDSKTRGLPCYLQKNCEKQGKVSGQNKKVIKSPKQPRQPKVSKPKRPRGRPPIDRRPVNFTNNDIISQIVNRDRTAIEKRVAEEEKQASKVAFEKGLEKRRGRPKSIVSSEPSAVDSTDLLFKGVRQQLQPKKASLASSASLSADSNLSDVDIDSFFKKFGKGSGASAIDTTQEDNETEIIDDEEIQTGSGIKKSNSNIKMANKWIEYVKSYASKNGMKYSEALKDPKCKAGYKTGGAIINPSKLVPASSSKQEKIAEIYNESQLGTNAGKKYISL